MIGYSRSQWESALSDLKDAAHDASVPYEQTDAWAVSHPADGSASHLGAYDDNGEFQRLAMVVSPDALRSLASLYAY